MTSEAWPEVRPTGTEQTARELLDQILNEARQQGTQRLDDISKAVEACMKGNCLQPGPQRGKPPPDPKHGTFVLFANMHAAGCDWAECLSALLHGEPESSRRQKS